MTRQEILKAAEDCVCRDRNATYGEPENSFGKLAAVWSARLGVTLQGHQVAIMLMDLKTARAWDNQLHKDNWIDMAGYAACGGEVAAKEYQALLDALDAPPEVLEKKSNDEQVTAACVVDWLKIPSDFKFVARDKDGSEWAYKHEPEQYDEDWYHYGCGFSRMWRFGVKMNFDGDWKDSLFERPEGM